MRSTKSEVVVAAPAGKVWAALTRPELVKQWQFGSDLITTWEPGSPIRFRTVWNDTVFEQWGTVLSFEPEQSLKYSLFAPRPGLEDRPENYFFMTYLLEEADGVTRVSFVNDDPRGSTGPDQPSDDEDEAGKAVLQQLKSLLERG